MESRFTKYENDGQTISNHIANVHNYIDWNYTDGLDLIEKEIQDLNRRIETGNAPAIFSNKKNLLIKLGKCIEALHETYHFNRGEA